MISVKCRLEAAKEKLLNNPEKPVWKICEEVGFENYEYFLRAFKEFYGVSPVKFKKGKYIEIKSNTLRKLLIDEDSFFERRKRCRCPGRFPAGGQSHSPYIAT